MGTPKGKSAATVVIAALGGNALITVAKSVAFVMTGSSAMLAEAFHSFADTGNQGLMLLGLKRAAKPADRNHPYGYGKETYFWSFVVSISIFTLGAAIAFYEGGHKLVELIGGAAHVVSDQTISIAVLVVAGAIETWVLVVAFKEFKVEAGELSLREALEETRTATIITVLFEDAAAVIGVLIALVGIGLSWVTGNPYFDAIATLLIGVVLASVAYFLGYMTKNLLIGMSASPRVENQIEGAVKSVPGVVRIVELKTLHMGADFILLNLGVEFAKGLKTGELEKIVDTIEAEVKRAVPVVKRIFIEIDSFRTKGDGPALAPAPGE